MFDVRCSTFVSFFSLIRLAVFLAGGRAFVKLHWRFQVSVFRCQDIRLNFQPQDTLHETAVYIAVGRATVPAKMVGTLADPTLLNRRLNSVFFSYLPVILAKAGIQ